MRQKLMVLVSLLTVFVLTYWAAVLPCRLVEAERPLHPASRLLRR